MPTARTYAQAVAAHLTEMVECGESDAFLEALGHIARAHGLAAIAKDSGLGRESLYKSLMPGANPRFETICKVVRGLGLRVAILPADRDRNG